MRDECVSVSVMREVNGDARVRVKVKLSKCKVKGKPT